MFLWTPVQAAAAAAAAAAVVQQPGALPPAAAAAAPAAGAGCRHLGCVQGLAALAGAEVGRACGWGTSACGGHLTFWSLHALRAHVQPPQERLQKCRASGRGSLRRGLRSAADLACASRMTTPRCVASASSAAQTGLRLRVAAAPRIHSACLARVMATFMRRTSARNPTPALARRHTPSCAASSAPPPDAHSNPQEQAQLCRCESGHPCAVFCVAHNGWAGRAVFQVTHLRSEARTQDRMMTSSCLPWKLSTVWIMTCEPPTSRRSVAHTHPHVADQHSLAGSGITPSHGTAGLLA